MTEPNNICSACVFRHGESKRDKVYQCCHATCAQFDEDCHALCDKCASCPSTGCTSPQTIPNRMFKRCLTQSNEPADAFRCCLTECGDDFLCQETCIDAYNAFVPVKEYFFLPLSTRNRGLLFYFAATAFHVLVLLRILPLPVTPAAGVLTVVAVYTGLYIILNK